jgi:class 3 adenylate cyclase/tetratricopeptide (TPR) repeat protein
MRIERSSVPGVRTGDEAQTIGAPLEQSYTPAMAVCARCGEESPERARFCLACGSPLDGKQLALETRRTVTVLFCDVTGSTSLGERQDPEQVRRVMSLYYDRARAVLEHHGGTVEKFVGDAVMSIFGIPVLHEDDALRALRAASELRDAIDSLNVELEQVFGVRISVRIGVNSGEVIAGNSLRGDSFAAGDAINVAQRLESAAAAGEILVGDTTYRLACDAVRTETVGPLTLKGKEEPVLAHRLLQVLPGLPSHSRRFDSAMVGREGELALLEDAFERTVRERSCHLFTVLGSAGVGKSRLVSEALRSIGERALVLTGACLSYGEGITFWPALEVVKQATGITDDDSPQQAKAKIAALLAGDDAPGLAAERVAALVGLDEAAAVAEEGFWGFRKLLETMAHRSAVVVVFDDVNWGEPTFLDLVEHVAEWTREAPILLVCLARPDLLDARPAWGGGKRNATTIFLEPLSVSESETLLENLLGDAVVARGVLARIQESAEGNPLFVEEMVSMLIDAGLLRRENENWVAGGDLSKISVPKSIQILLASRLDQLSSDERQVLERGSLEGTVFHRGAIEALIDGPVRQRVSECLQRLVRKELVRPHQASFAGEDAFRFRHVLIRDAAYDSMPKQVRAELHERFASWLEEVTGERVAEYEEVLGYHLEQAFRFRAELTSVDERTRATAVRAAARLTAAGRRALGRSDIPAAVNLLERSKALVGAADAGAPQLLLDLGTALREGGDLARADSVLVEAIEAAESAGQTTLAERARIERATLQLLLEPDFDLDEALALSQQAIGTFERAGDEQGLAKAWRLVANVNWARCRCADMEEMLERALVHAERAGDQREISEIRDGLCRVALLGPAPVEDGIRRCRDTLEHASDDLQLQAIVQCVLAVLVAARGSFDEARDLLDRAQQVFDELGLSLKRAASMWVAYVDFLAGDSAAAERELTRGYYELERMGEKSQFSTTAGLLARAVCDQGRLEEAQRYTLVSEEAASADDVASQVLWRATRARVLARQGDFEQADRLAREAVDLAEQTDWLDLQADSLVDLADVLRVAGRADQAEGALGRAIALYQAKGNTVSVARARERLEGVLRPA